MGLAKASVVMLYRRINIYQNSHKLFYTVVATIVFWTIFSTFATAFQCRGPHLWQWNVDKCPRAVDYAFATGVMNVVTDILIVLYVIPGFWNLNMAQTLRLIVIFLFSCRILYFARIKSQNTPLTSTSVAAAAIADLVLLKQIHDWSDLTWVITAWAVVDR
jgi:hypothetical protein